ncbi:MAG: hypothetical protein K6E73_11475 [Bacteroidales bacterium]|nr:hypothetical protein [Bacteroidales bacterium]
MFVSLSFSAVSWFVAAGWFAQLANAAEMPNDNPTSDTALPAARRSESWFSMYRSSDSHLGHVPWQSPSKWQSVVS